MSSVIYYGMGLYLRENYNRFVLETGEPVCIVDKDETKYFSEFEGKMVLPLQHALEKYPEYKIYVCLIPWKIPFIENELINNGVSAQKISRFSRGHEQCEQDTENRSNETSPKWCDLLGQYFVVDIAGWSYCCEPQREVYCMTGDTQKDIKRYKDVCAKKIDELKNGLICSCSDCYHLQTSQPPDNYPQLSRFNLSTGLAGGTRCNLKCGYCTYRDLLDSNDTVSQSKQNVYEICHVIAEECGSDANILYASGEITVLPYKNEILALWNKMLWSGTICTSGVIYNQDIAELSSAGKVRIEISLDAGTGDTFAKVKGADCFGKVCDTISKYSQNGGVITLKYILLYGLNDNQDDVDGFIHIAASIGASVILSMDNSQIFRTLKPSEAEAAIRFIRLANEYGLTLDCLYAWFNPADRPIIENAVTAYSKGAE